MRFAAGYKCLVAIVVVCGVLGHCSHAAEDAKRHKPSHKTNHKNNDVRTAATATLTLPQSFFQSVINGFSPTLETVLTNMEFPKTGNEKECSSVLINAGRWFDNVSIPRTTAVATPVGSATTAAAIAVAISGVNVTGLLGKKSWSSNQLFTLPGAWSTCFQLCFGTAPFTTLTTFSANLALDIAAGRPISVTAPRASLAHDGEWHIANVADMCVGDIQTFDATFNAGIAPGLNSAAPTVASAFGAAYDSILSNSSASGFAVSEYDSKSGSYFFATLANMTAAPAYSAFPNLLSSADAQVTAVVQLPTATSIQSATTARCVEQAPCGSPFGSGNLMMQYARCSACVQSVGGQMYLAFGSETAVATRSSMAKPGQHQHHRRQAKHHPIHVAASEPRVAVKRENVQPKALPSNAPASAKATTGFINLDLLTQTASLVGTEAASLLSAVTTASAANAALTNVEDYCTVSHAAFAWDGVPSTLAIVATKVELDAGRVLAFIQLPALGVISGGGRWSSSCEVPLPLGTPFRDAASGTFKVNMTAPSSAFTVQILITADGVSVVEYPQLTFAASVAYDAPGAAATFTFDAFLQDYFVNGIGASAISQTTDVLRDTITNLWIGQLVGLVKSYAGATSAQAVFDPAQKWSVSLTTSPTLMPTDATLQNVVSVTNIPSIPVQSAQIGGFVAVLGSAPTNFTVPTSCAQRLSCSLANAGSDNVIEILLSPPLSQPASMRNCTSCVTIIDGQILLGSRFALPFTPSPGPLSSAKRRDEASVIISGAADPVTARKKQVARARAAPIPPTAAAVDSSLYLGLAALTNAITPSGAEIVTALANYGHASVKQRAVPYVEAYCSVTHGSFKWNVPAAVTPTVTSIMPDPTTAAAVLVNVSLVGLPQKVQSTVAAFSTGCAVTVELPIPFVEEQDGTVGLAIEFADPQPTVELRVTATAGVVSASVVGMTAFAVKSAYGYHAPTPSEPAVGFTLDPFIANYFGTTLASEVHAEVVNVLQQEACPPIAEYANDLLAAVASSGSSCAVAAFGAKHVKISAGPTCAQSLPAPAAALRADQVAYMLDAGPLPSVPAFIQSASSLQSLSACSMPASVASPLGGMTQLRSCQTQGMAANGHLIIAINGTVAQ